MKRILSLTLILSLFISLFQITNVNAEEYIVYADGEYYDGDVYVEEPYGIQLLSDITVYYQGRGQVWSNYSYGYGTTIAQAGCGLLSLTNAIYYLNGSFINPTVLADFSLNNGYRIQNNGTSWSFFQGAAKKFGSEYGFSFNAQTSSISTLKAHLQNGGVATCRKPGHFMAVVDYNANTETYLLLDSAPSAARGTSSGYAWKTAAGLSDIGINVYFLLNNENSTDAPITGEREFTTNIVNGLYISSSSFAITGNFHDYGTYPWLELFVDYEYVATTCNNEYYKYAFYLDTTKYADGNHKIGIKMLNQDGLDYTWWYDVVIDNTSPAISDVTITDVSSSGYTVNLTIEDNLDISVLSIFDWTTNNGQDDIVWTEYMSSGKITHRVDTSKHNNEMGEYNTHIYLYDKANNVTVQCVGETIKPDEREFTVNIENGSILSGSSYPIGGAFHDYGTYPWLELYVDYAYVATTCNNEYYIYAFYLDTTKYSDGTHKIGIKMRNQDGLDYTWWYDIVIDNTNIITFEANGGSVSTSNKTVAHNSTYGTLPIPIRSGYKFKGWYTSANGGVEITSDTQVNTTSDQVLYAQWEELIPYTDSIVTKNGSNYYVNVVPINIEDSCEIIVAAYKGGKFVTLTSTPYNQIAISTTLSGDIDEIKVMVWNSLSRLKPLCDAEVIPSSEFIIE